MKLWLLLVAPAALAQPVRFVEHRIAKLDGERIRGAALDASTLFTWGERLLSWGLPAGKMQELARGPFGEGGCLLDNGRLVLQEGLRLDMLVARGPGGKRQVIDTGVETHDCLAAALHGRRGVLVVHRYAQVRFYEPGEPWRYREIYSFYTPSQQAGLLVADVDGDGRPDILCGNYWIRSPERFDLPWRLFAINTYSEAPLSAMARLALARMGSFGLVVAEGEVRDARLAWFERPADPTGLWKERRLDQLHFPHALAVADFDGDGSPDIFVGENNGAGSRLLVFWGGSRRDQIAACDGAVAVFVVDLNGDGRPDVVIVGPSSVSWWENRYFRR